jgi:hypothetical protein
MSVTHIGLPANQRTLEVLSELTELAMAGDLKGFAYVAEVGDESPKFGAAGRFHSDPWRALAVLTRLREQFESRRSS